MKIQEMAEVYFEEVQTLAKSITVFDKGLPEGVEDINEISHNDILTVKYIYSRISYNEMMANWQDTRSLLLKEN